MKHKISLATSKTIPKATVFLNGNGEEEAWDQAAETARATAWEGLVKFDDNAELVDSKLWPGAASAGWQLKSNSGR